MAAINMPKNDKKDPLEKIAQLASIGTSIASIGSKFGGEKAVEAAADVPASTAKFDPFVDAGSNGMSRRFDKLKSLNY